MITYPLMYFLPVFILERWQVILKERKKKQTAEETVWPHISQGSGLLKLPDSTEENRKFIAFAHFLVSKDFYQNDVPIAVVGASNTK